MSAFIYGAILALGLIIPLGIQNIFIFNQGATQKHFVFALPAVLTAFICDSLLILCAVLGVSVAVLTIPILKTIILGIGIIFLLYMGWLTWKSSIGRQTAHQPFSAKRQIAFAISVSLLNPHALLDTIGVIGTNSLNFYGSAKWAYTSACILISLCWFLFLSAAGAYCKKLDKHSLIINNINKLSALIMWGTAIFLGWQMWPHA